MADWTDVLNYLKESDAKLVSYEQQQLNLDAKLVRKWEKVDPKLVTRMIEFLDLYTSVKNYTANAPGKFYVDNPVAVGERGVEAYPTRYRQVRHYRVLDPKDPTNTAVYQELADGYIQTIDYQSARIMSDPAYPTDQNGHDLESYVTVQFKHIDPAYVKTHAETLLATGIMQNIVIGLGTAREVTLTGQWYVISATPTVEEDGIYVDNVVFARPETDLNGYMRYMRPGGEDVFYKFGVPKIIAQSIVDQWKATQGAGASATISYANGLAHLQLMRPNINPLTQTWISEHNQSVTATETMVWGSNDPTLYPAEAHPMYGKTGWTITRNVSENFRSATFNIHLVARQTLYQHLPQYIRENVSGFIDMREEHLGVGDDESGLGLPDPTLVIPGTSITTNRTLRPDGSKNISIDQRILKELAVGTSGYITFPTRYGTGSLRVRRNATQLELLQDITQLTAATHNSINVHPGDEGKLDYSISAIPFGENGGTPWPETAGLQTWNFKVVKFRHAIKDDGSREDQVRTWTYTVTINEQVTYHACINWLNQYDDVIVGSGVEHRGGFRYVGKLIKLWADTGWVKDNHKVPSGT